MRYDKCRQVIQEICHSALIFTLNPSKQVILNGSHALWQSNCSWKFELHHKNYMIRTVVRPSPLPVRLMLLADFDHHNHTPIKKWARGAHLLITELGTRELNETGPNKIILKKKGHFFTVNSFILLLGLYYRLKN